MAARETAARLKAWALEAGFDRAGVAVLEPSRDGRHFLAWLERGDHASMGYLRRRLEVRLDPRRLFGGARSVLCVALQYHPFAGGESSGDLWPWVARYAHGRDYHDVMERRLRQLAARVEAAFPGAGWRAYVDTGPVLERELAARAGLGVVGKNTNLLHAEAGSWFLLGELFLDLDLAPDAPLSDLCGSCSRCLEACPTGALPEPYRLDSSRCISYWTIEHRGAIPEAVRPTLGRWVFGCDVCQEVCPLNAQAGAATVAELELPPHRGALDLAGLLGICRRRYVETFRGSPMKRAKQEGLQRNAAIAMGNSGERTYVGPLAEALEQESAVVRGHAAWALGRLGGAAAEAALRRALGREPDPEVRRELAAALAHLGASESGGERGREAGRGAQERLPG